MKRVFLFLWAHLFLVTAVSFSHAALKDYETWMGTYFQGKKLGFTSIGKAVINKATGTRKFEAATGFFIEKNKPNVNSLLKN